MLHQPPYYTQPRFYSPTAYPISTPTKPSVIFTYQSSPLATPHQSLKVIKELKESCKKRRIFSPKRKTSVRSTCVSRQRKERLRIFDEEPGNLRVNTMHSHIFLKDSVLSGADTIVDQLQEFSEHQPSPPIPAHNPIGQKLFQMKTHQRNTKRTFESKTVKNSILVNSKMETFPIKRNRIDSEVLHYNICPQNNPKHFSTVTIKASKDTRSYGVSKISNGLSILTNGGGNEDFSEFRDCQNVETPKNHRSSYKVMRKSFDPSCLDNLIAKERFQHTNTRKHSTINPTTFHPQYPTYLHPQYPPKSDRFYDQSSMQTPRLPVASKKISYQLIDPLTSSLRKQKLEKKQYLRKLSQQQEAKKMILANNSNKHGRVRAMVMVITAYVMQGLCRSKDCVRDTKTRCVNFTRSEVFVVGIVVMLSLTIFVLQLVQ